MSKRIGRPAGAALLAMAVAVLPVPGARASGLQTLYQFTGGADGATPYKSPTLDASGTLYGGTFYGANACPDSFLYPGVGCGTTYKLSGSTLTPLVTFLGSSNGADADGNLLLAGPKLYGTTYTGGPDNQGTVFVVNTNGTGYRRIHSFTGADGEHPDSFIRADSAGNGYSITPYGGPAYTGTDQSGFGVLFQITSTGHYVPLHPFSGGADGGVPGRIFLDSSGNIFGATSVGGSCATNSAGCGVVYEYTIVSGQFQVLYTFTGGTDSATPILAGFDAAGNLYGSTFGGGAHNYGTLFKLIKGASSYSYAKLWDFTGGADGANPATAPALTANGTMVGTTVYGPVVGSNFAFGTLWKFSGGQVHNLYAFTGGADGGYPESTPVLNAAGAIYSTTAFGGIQPCMTSGGALISIYGCGTIFKYVP